MGKQFCEVLPKKVVEIGFASVVEIDSRFPTLLLLSPLSSSCETAIKVGNIEASTFSRSKLKAM